MRLVGSGTAWSVAVLVVLAICCLLQACSGRAPSIHSEPAQAPMPEPAALQGSLPDLASLPEPPRAASYLGHGWYQVPVLEQGVLVKSSGAVSVEADGVHITAGTNLAWAIFSVHGFDGDSFPTALASEVAAGAGEYSLATGNYLSGRWEPSSPFTANGLYEYQAGLKGSNPQNYLSPRGVHYIAVIASAGSSIILNGLQLAVDSGHKGPAATVFLSRSRNSLGVQLTWAASADDRNPDFAGYAIERADWPGSDFSEISPLQPQRYYFDDTALDGKLYRYRIRCEDLAGNSSTSTSIVSLALNGDLPPVCILDLPAGPLYGAQDVIIDLSGSFDRDGDEITEYSVSFGFSILDTGIESIAGPDSSFTLRLQPGCYNIIGRVLANGRTGSSWTQLKVYPVWETEPQHIASAPKTAPAISGISSTYVPELDSVASFGMDPLLPGIAVSAQTSQGVQRFIRLVPQRLEIIGISEAVEWNGMALCAVVDTSTSYVCYFDGEELDWLGFARGFVKGTNLDLVVASDGNPYTCYIEQNNMPVSRIVSARHTGNFPPVELVPDFNGEHPFDVEWNQQQQSYDILYGQPSAIRFRRCDIDGNLLFEKNVSFSTPAFLDLEIDPATGSPGILWRAGASANFTQYDNDSGFFLPTEPVDPLQLSSFGEDLAYAASVPVVFMGSPGQPAGLYHRTGGTWQRMPADWSADSGQDSALASWPDGRLSLLDRDISKRIWMLDVLPGESMEVISAIEPTGPQGRDLNAVAGSDGLHAVWNAGGETVHYANAEDGSGWNLSESAGDTDSLDLMADREGNVYLSTRQGGASFLVQWNGASWDVIWFTLNNLDQTNPWLCMQSNAPTVHWMYMDESQPGSDLHYVTDQHGQVMKDYPSSIGLERVNEGCGIYSGQKMVSMLSLDDNFYLPAKHLALLDFSRSSVSTVLYTGDNRALDISGLRGRLLDASMAKDSLLSDITVFYSAIASREYGVIRYSGYSGEGAFIMQDEDHLQFPPRQHDWQQQCSVSVAQAWGVTCVGIIDESFEGEAILEWDDYGNWERLPLPPVDFAYTNMHELVVGNDGRWHMLYHDIDDGGIWSISTTE